MTKIPKIAIIDDDENAVELLEYNTSKNGMDTICFSDSETAIKYLLNHKVDLVVTDWMMPRKSGIEVIEALKNSINSDTNKIMVSCISNPKSIKIAKEVGVVYYAVKPIKVIDFVARLKTLTLH